MTTDKRYEFEVTVDAAFVIDQTEGDQHRYVFSYTIKIANVGTVPAQLISRHWIITDSSNEVQEVRGLGVVGEQPLLKPGEQFQYTSGAVLNTPDGFMEGTYHITAEDGTQFDVKIPRLVLSMPRVIH